jgi:regulator of sigma E protease
MTVIAAGPFVNIVVAFVVLTGVLTFFDPVLKYGIASVEKGSPAALAGIKSSDEIVKWGDASASGDIEKMQRAIEKSRGKDVTLVVKNADGVTRTERLSPVVLARDKKAAAKADKGEEAAAPVKRIGVNFELERTAWQRRNPVSAAGDSVQFMWLITVGQVKGLSRAVLPEGRKEISSVVGIVKIAPEVQKRDNLLTYIAVISMALAVLNLLPILPLDGGHLMFGLIEFLRRGRPLPRSAFERYSIVGIAFVLMLFVIGLSNDVGLSS